MDNKRISEIIDEEMIKQDANRYRDMRKILTIPKSIAEKADKTDLDKIYCFGAQEFYWLFGHENDKYVPIIFAYLAGKALGVDLVKVVEG
ncbi:hypothetical protein ikelab_15610 [Lactococcus garvieae]|uniref:Phage protein n=1 Tax=Lactococcus garvieae TaxID=1363 RepID=A0A6L2ZWU3_9LACT|nr:hypothetical protein [Lactococcus garvieae]GFO52286.1 hypothetical protein ikelab_15610 [Lactococcus garvieae]